MCSKFRGRGTPCHKTLRQISPNFRGKLGITPGKPRMPRYFGKSVENRRFSPNLTFKFRKNRLHDEHDQGEGATGGKRHTNAPKGFRAPPQISKRISRNSCLPQASSPRVCPPLSVACPFPNYPVFKFLAPLARRTYLLTPLGGSAGRDGSWISGRTSYSRGSFP